MLRVTVSEQGDHVRFPSASLPREDGPGSRDEDGSRARSNPGEGWGERRAPGWVPTDLPPPPSCPRAPLPELGGGGVIAGARTEMTCHSALAEKGLSIL